MLKNNKMNISNIKNKFAILVISCDKYSDLWNPFFKLFFRFWPDCPFNVYLISNYKITNFPKVKTINIGRDISWSDNLYKGLNLLREDYVFLLLEDCFLINFVNTNKMLELFNWILNIKANCVRMDPRPKPDKKYNELIGIVSKGTIYRASSAICIWKREILLNLLKAAETAWDFEIYGSIRSDIYSDFYSTCNNYFPNVHCVVRGKWQRSAIKKLKSFGIQIDLNTREVMTLEETIIYIFRQLRSKLLKFFPAKYRRRIRNFILSSKYNK
jgi:hypothetical protein